MPARSRSRAYYEDGGLRYREVQGEVVINESGDQIKGTSTCHDVVGTRVDHPLEIIQYNRDWCTPLSGEHSPGPGYLRKYDAWIPTAMRTNNVSHLTSLPASPSDGALATTLMARTNPNRPHISLPAFAGELPEIPSLFEKVGRRLIKDGANTFLKYQYGWKPLINDMGNFLDFNKATQNRIGELRRLYSKSGLKRRITLQTDTVVGAESIVTIESGLGLLVRAKQQSVTQRKIWGTIRWLPTEIPNRPLTDAEYLDYARRLVLGLQRGTGLSDLDFKALAGDIWQIMPWSWLADWGANIGEYLDAHRNTAPVQATRINVMKHTTTWRTYRRNPGVHDAYTWLQGGDGGLRYETKTRSQPSASLAASVPFLSPTKVAILGALGIQRMKLRI